MRSKKLEHTALLGLGIQIAFLCAGFALYSVSGSTAVYAEIWHMIPGLLVWFTVLLHGRQRRLADEEREELEELKKERLSEELFEETELDTMRARTGLRIFQKYFVPALSVLISLSLGFLVYHVVAGTWPRVGTVEVQQPAVVGVGMLFITFVGFLIGKYCAGLARDKKFRLLRAAAGYILGNVAVCLLITLSMGAMHFGILWPERILTYVIPVLMGLLALEIILNLVLDIYRPRVPGQEPRPPYDSRLLGLFAEPEGVLRTLAATLDYQFGFKVSETWFYRFMERAIVPLIVVWLVTLWLLTCLGVVHQNEVAFIESFGRPRLKSADESAGLRATVYEPGYYLKLPWPFEVVRRVPAYETHRLELGKVEYEELKKPPEEEQQTPVMTNPNIVLWGERHIQPQEGYEMEFLVPPPTEEEAVAEEGAAEAQGLPWLTRASAFVQYQVKREEDGTIDPQAVWQYYYRHSNAENMIRHLAYGTLSEIAASQNLQAWMSGERDEFNQRFKKELQRVVDKHGLGARIVSAAVPVVSPPPEVASAFQSVYGAVQQKQATIAEAQAQAKQMVEEAKSEAVQRTAEAESYRYEVTKLANAQANRFETQAKAYERAPEVYRYRKYLTALEDLLVGHRLYLLPVDQDRVQILDLQERMRSELLQFDVEEATQ